MPKGIPGDGIHYRAPQMRIGGQTGRVLIDIRSRTADRKDNEAKRERSNDGWDCSSHRKHCGIPSLCPEQKLGAAHLWFPGA
jgi:hypothetical protein